MKKWEAVNRNRREMRTGSLMATIAGCGAILLSGCSREESGVGSGAASANPMQHGPEYFTSKWGPPIDAKYTDEWGNPAPKATAKGTAIKWKINDRLTVEVQAVADTVQCIQYTGQPGADMFWTAEQIRRALEPNGHGWTETQFNPLAVMIMGTVAPIATFQLKEIRPITFRSAGRECPSDS